MAVRAPIQYMMHRVIRELGLGCYVPASVAAGATSMRVMDATLFDPAGGQIFVEDNDNLITYTGINEDSTLTGIPASGTGSITATINSYTSASRDLIYRAELMTSYEWEIMFDRYRRFIDAEKLSRDSTRKKHFSLWRWYDTGVILRDGPDPDDDVVVTPDTIDYENGRFEFNAARADTEQLYAFGETYNVFFVIGDFIESFANDARWYSYSQIGQAAFSSKNAHDIAEIWRGRGRNL
jgi:hypothetical protein